MPAGLLVLGALMTLALTFAPNNFWLEPRGLRIATLAYALMAISAFAYAGYCIYVAAKTDDSEPIAIVIFAVLFGMGFAVAAGWIASQRKDLMADQSNPDEDG